MFYKSLKTILLTALLTSATVVDSSAQTNADAKLRSLFADEVVARGTGFEIKRSTLDESVVTIRASAAGRGSTIAPAVMQRLEREVLRRLINIELLKQKATEEDRQQGEQVAEERMALLLEKAGSEEAMNRQLKAVGMTSDRLKAKLTEEATAEKVLARELNIQISDEQIQAFYDENPAKFEQPEMVRAAHILLSTRDPATNQELSDEEKAAKRRQMDSILEKARKGDNFAELAVEYSEDPGSKDKGGEYTFPRGRMVPEFEAAAFSMEPDEISDVITTKFGYHIIKLYEKMPAKTVELDDKIKPELREFLKSREIQKQMGPYMEQLSEETSVEILDEDLKPQPGDNPASDINESMSK